MYLDPGFGGMLIQIIAVFIATGGALLFAFRKKLSAFFKKSKNKSAEPSKTVDDVVGEADSDVIDVLGDDASGK